MGVQDIYNSLQLLIAEHSSLLCQVPAAENGGGRAVDIMS